MTVEKNHMIIGMLIIVLVGGAYYMGEPTDDTQVSLTIVNEGTVSSAEYLFQKFFTIFGGFEGTTSKTLTLQPSTTYTMIWEVMNTEDTNNVYTASVMDWNQKTLDSITAKTIYSGQSWSSDMVKFTTPSSPGTYSMWISGEYFPLPIGSGPTEFENWVELEIVIPSEPTPTPTATPTPYPTPTPTPTPQPTPTPTPTPDNCDGVTCNPYCEGTTYKYNGYCDNGQCVYQSEYNSAQCSTPTPTPTVTPTATPTETGTNGGDEDDEDDEDDLNGILMWGGAIIGVLLVLLMALRAKK